MCGLGLLEALPSAGRKSGALYSRNPLPKPVLYGVKAEIPGKNPARIVTALSLSFHPAL